MQVAQKATAHLKAVPRGTWVGFLVVAAAVVFATLALESQSAPATPQSPAPENAAPAETQPAPKPARPDRGPVLSSPPVAIVPVDKSIPGAALSVEGPMQAWNGRAFITGSCTITAGTETAQVTLPRRGTLRVCASSAVNLEANANAPAGEFPGLLIALDHGAIEMSFAASSAREYTADTLLTPYFRILIGGPNAADVKVRLGQHGDTCVDNFGADAPYVAVSSVFDGGVYRVQPGQRVMFEHGSLQSVVDQEQEPCGCPPAAGETSSNDFPLAQSEGLAPIPPAPSAPPVAATKRPAEGEQATTTLVYSGGEHAPQTVAIPAPAAASPATAPANQTAQTESAQEPQPKKKPGFFGKIGRFFKRMFGAE